MNTLFSLLKFLINYIPTFDFVVYQIKILCSIYYHDLIMYNRRHFYRRYTVATYYRVTLRQTVRIIYRLSITTLCYAHGKYRIDGLNRVHNAIIK